MGLTQTWGDGTANEDPVPESPTENETAPVLPVDPVDADPADAPPSDAAWWASLPHDDADPPVTNQVALVAAAPDAPAANEAPDAQEAAPPAPSDPSDSPTAPHSLLALAQAVAALTNEPAKVETAPLEADTLTSDAFEGTRQLAEDSAPAMVAHHSQQGLSAMAARDIGRIRETNQDSAFAMITTLPREGHDMTVGLFIVADGMGGHHGGEIASRLAVRTVVQYVLSDLILPTLDDTMGEALQPLMISAVQAANRAIWEQGQAIGSDMGTTCTAALLVGQGLYIAHVGDSRAYLYEPGGLRQITTDHSTVGRLIQVGQLDPQEAREHPLRNQLYRTIGQQPQVPVDFLYQPLGIASHVLLCSDGLWGMVDDPQIQQALSRSPWPQDSCNELIALANLAGGDDNISAVVVALPLAER